MHRQQEKSRSANKIKFAVCVLQVSLTVAMSLNIVDLVLCSLLKFIGVIGELNQDNISIHQKNYIEYYTKHHEHSIEVNCSANCCIRT